MLDKIFCVDDDPITLMLCKKVIERVEFAKEIITAQDGEEAIKFFDDLASSQNNGEVVSYPKLTFLDLNMPVMNGWEFLDVYLQKDYQTLFPEAKFIVLSSTIDPDDVNQSMKYPVVVDFMSKPITKEMLENLKTRF
ncbi:response regulator [Flavobacterium silvisoli]|uniref:Response regulator n=1 Tax=Flavobacterium silvisoli TaxID=2529433 RepID=A0A4Q9Z5F5_9FLAO|nr:response regulator [Flavobacterium silvisoli]TBX69198.1 response regulator [Flavobacterium silvisoli]